MPDETVLPDAPPQPADFAPLVPIVETPEDKKRLSFPVVAVGITSVLGAAGVAGGVWHFVAQSFNLLFINAILAGLLAGFLVGYSLAITRTRNDNFVAICGLVAAMLTMGSRFCYDAYASRGEIIEAMLTETGRNDAAIRAKAESYLTPPRLLRIYLAYRTETGARIGRRSATNPTVLTGGAYWGLVFLETGAMAIAGGAIATMRRRRCDDCGKPLTDIRLFTRHSNVSDAVLALAHTQRWQEISALPKPERVAPVVTDSMADYEVKIATRKAQEATEQAQTTVTLAQCGGKCAAYLRVETRDSSAPAKPLLQARVSQESADVARAVSSAEPI